MASRILVVDDDPHIRDVICFALEKAEHEFVTARDGAEALVRFAEAAPDLVVLDVGMPEMDGLEVCREIRKTSNVPILFLSARDDEIDRVLGLEIGGDDYVTKPFSPRELIARVAVILKRVAARPAAEPEPEAPLSHGALYLDPERHLARFDGADVALTSIEFAILKAFLGRPGIVFDRERIVASAYGDGMHVSDRTVDSHIRNVRAKLQAAGCDGGIETVHGVGFRLGPCEAAR